MESYVLNAEEYDPIPGAGYSETRRIALPRVVSQMQVAEGGTIFIPTGVYEFAGAINMEVSTEASAAGTIRITGKRDPTLVMQDKNKLFVVTNAPDESAAIHVIFEGLRFEEAFKAA
jgi:hypothetical protein